jgi:hypothetical protein
MLAAHLRSNKGQVKSQGSLGLAEVPFERSAKVACVESHASARHSVQQQPFTEYKRASADPRIEQTLGSSVLLMLLCIAEPRFINSIDDKGDVPRGIPADNEEESKPPISQLANSRTQY